MVPPGEPAQASRCLINGSIPGMPPGTWRSTPSCSPRSFAKEQLDLMLQEFFLHLAGQIPASEWNFSDVNPPVHAWATIFLYRTEQAPLLRLREIPLYLRLGQMMQAIESVTFQTSRLKSPSLRSNDLLLRAIIGNSIELLNLGFNKLSNPPIMNNNSLFAA
jgi:hypothetical protein